MAARRRNKSSNRQNEDSRRDSSVWGDERNKNGRHRSTPRRQKRGSGVSPLTLRACAILIVAIVFSVVWNYLDSTVDPKVQSFLQKICNLGGKDSVYCHVGLVPSRRTQKTTRNIFRGETILEIPRHLQIWDIDALRDPFVRTELLEARSEDGHALSSAAFLAAFLAHLQQKIRNKSTDDIHPVLVSYLTNVLPTYDDYATYHPILWTEDELATSLGKHSSTYAHVQGHRMVVFDEYKAFVKASSAFSYKITKEEYLTARLNVMTRSFGTGKLQQSDSANKDDETSHTAAMSHDWLDAEELAFFQAHAGLDLSLGSYAMVPVLDLYDHHAKPNVAFRYNAHKRAFVVTATTAMAVGQEVMDSYGKRTDSDLFAKYGFVNGDGSGWTQAGLNLWHATDVASQVRGDSSVVARDLANKKQKALLLNYLKYDDGYENCVDPKRDKVAWELKKLKFQYLLQIAPETARWVAQMSARDISSQPALSTDTPISIDPPKPADLKKVQFDGTLIFGTCRLLSLTHMDYDGRAMEVLQNATLQGATPGAERPAVLRPTNDGLEYRTQLCVARLASTALGRFGTSIGEQEEVVALLNRQDFGGRNWTIAHLHLGEMHSLKTLQQVAFTALRRIFGEDALEARQGEALYSMRNDPCPPELQKPLLKLI